MINTKHLTQQCETKYMTTPMGFQRAIRFTLLMTMGFAFVLVLARIPVVSSFIYNLDVWTFNTLNKVLSESTVLQAIFGVLNHKKETKLNLVFMAFINFYCIFAQPKDYKLKTFLHILFFWGFFELGFRYQDWYFIEHLGIRRDSPSLVLEPFIMLSQALGNPMIKDTADCCFPSGHASALLFWFGFSVFYMPTWLKRLMTPIIIILLFPRVFSGAHWLTDILFSCGLTSIWLGVGFIAHALVSTSLARLFYKNTKTSA